MYSIQRRRMRKMPKEIKGLQELEVKWLHTELSHARFVCQNIFIQFEWHELLHFYSSRKQIHICIFCLDSPFPKYHILKLIFPHSTSSRAMPVVRKRVVCVSACTVYVLMLPIHISFTRIQSHGEDFAYLHLIFAHRSHILLCKFAMCKWIIHLFIMRRRACVYELPLPSPSLSRSRASTEQWKQIHAWATDFVYKSNLDFIFLLFG